MLAYINPQHLLNIPVLLFVFAFGCCAGSFINVLVYRLPRGEGIVRPPSRCPGCETRLTWRENFPVLGWLWLGGRCRFCKIRISPEYPIVELSTGLLLAVLYVLYYIVPADLAVLSGRSPDWAHVMRANIVQTWPMFAAHALLVTGLIAMTLIDARHYIIPLGIPWTLTVVGIGANVLQTFTVRQIVPRTGWEDPGNWALVPTMTWTGFAVVLSGCIGIGIGVLLVETGLLRRSFHDYEEWAEGEQKRLQEANADRKQTGEAGGDPGAPESGESPDEEFDLSAYPHPRREMLRELLFLAPCLGLMMLFFQLGTRMGWSAEPPPWVMALGGSLLGYLIGGSVVWAVRILGSLAFGKEAMGLGDVHMMAGVGAVLGWVDPVLAFFFAAPFLGLGYALLAMGPGRMVGSLRKPIPYGPFLALGVLLIMLFKHEYEWFLTRLLGGNIFINLP